MFVIWIAFDTKTVHIACETILRGPYLLVSDEIILMLEYRAQLITEGSKTNIWFTVFFIVIGRPTWLLPTSPLFYTGWREIYVGSIYLYLPFKYCGICAIDLDIICGITPGICSGPVDSIVSGVESTVYINKSIIFQERRLQNIRVYSLIDCIKLIFTDGHY